MSPILRCSELDRVLACPGSLTLNAIVAHRQGDEGGEGTALHHIAHARMVSELGASGNPGTTHEMPASLSFSIWIADYYFSFVQETAPADWSLEVECALAFKFDSPIRIVTDAKSGEHSGAYGFTLSGHIDAVAISPDASEAIGFDLKTGYDPVDVAEMNEQVLGYCVLLLRAYPDLLKITFHIIQPRNDEDEGFQRVSSVVIEGDILARISAGLEARINDALANGMEVSTGLRACKWCSAAIVCPAQIQLREQMKATLTPELLETLKATPDDSVLGDWVISGRVINRALEDAETLLKERINANGHLIAGDGTQVTIKKQGGSYTFPNSGAFYAATRRLLPDDDAYAATVKPSVVKTKEAIAKARGIPKTSSKGMSAASVFEQELKPLCEQGTKEILVFQ